jgi:hypothetical protein
MGVMVESTLRKHAGRMFGEQFAKSYTINSMIDFATLLGSQRQGAFDYDEMVMGWARENVCKVCDVIRNGLDVKALEGFHRHLCASLRSKVLRTQLMQTSWRDAQGYVDIVQLGRSIGEFSAEPGNGPNIEKLVRFRDYFERKNDNRLDSAWMASCRSPCLMMFIFDNNEQFYHGNPVAFPATSLECDLKPLVQVHGLHVTIRCGEIKSSSVAINSAKQQLAIRLRCIKAASEILLDPRPSNFLLLGDVFFVDDKDEVEAHSETEITDISFYLHRVKSL